MEQNKNRNTNLGQQSNQDWDDANDQKTSGSSQPNPERFQDANLGQGSGSLSEQEEWSTGSERPESDRSTQSEERSSGKSAFNERHQSTGGYGSSQRSERDNVGPLDADLNDLPSERRSGNQSGPGLG